MRIYYFDDSGQRTFGHGDKYFILGGFGIDADDVGTLTQQLNQVKLRFGFPLTYPAELKFNEIARQKPKGNGRHWMLEAGLDSVNLRRAFAYSCLRILNNFSSVRGLIVAVDLEAQASSHRRNTSAIESGIHPLLERVQYDCQDRRQRALVMMDEERTKDRDLRELLRRGSTFVKFDRFDDSIAFMPSGASPGIQLADLIAGAFHRSLNYNDTGYLYPVLRIFDKNPSKLNGRGVKIFPTGQFCPPTSRVSPWTPRDREIHTHEMANFPGTVLSWCPDGSPSHYWPGDWDSPAPHVGADVR